jgi:hypothetical protein
MTALLAEFEKAGYRFRLDGEEVMVRGPQRLLDAEHIERVRQHKPDIRRELVLRNFVDLVRVTGACEFGFLFHRDQIEAEIDKEGCGELPGTTRHFRQAWARAIASRLARARIAPSWLQAIDRTKGAQR